MIRQLHNKLHIPTDVLIQPYTKKLQTPNKGGI